MSKKRTPKKMTRQAKGRVIALVAAVVMALSLAAYYFNAAGPGPAPAGNAGDPSEGDRYVQDGNRAYDAGDYAAAIRSYEKALPWRGRDPGVLTDLGTAYFYRTPSEPERAIACYDRALAVSPGFPNALFNKGIVLLQGKGDPDGAIAVWEQLLATLPAGDPLVGQVTTFIANARAARTTNPPPVAAPPPPAPAPPATGSGSKLSSGFGR